MAGLAYTFSLGATLASSFRGAMTGARGQIRGIAADVRTMENSSTGRLGSAFAASSQKLSGLTAELRSARANLASLKDQARAAGGANDLLARQIGQAEKNVSRLTSSLKGASNSHRELAARITTEAGSVGNLMREYRDLAAQMEKARAKQKALSANLAAREANKSRRSSLRGEMFDTVALAASVALPVKMAVDFESSMADAAKTIEGMRDDAGKLTPMYFAMVREAKNLGRELPLSHSKIASIMATAGQMGLTDAKDIATFTRDAAQMAVAFGMSNEEAAEAIGGYRTALGLAQDDVREMLDLMNYFANTSSASEAGISDIVRRVGALGGVAGVSHKPLTALAATLDSMKIAPEVAATGIQNLMLAMNQGSAATKKQRDVLASLGMNAQKLSRRMQTDATGAILQFLRAVQKLPKHEQAAALTHYFGRESVKSIAPLLTQLDLLEENFRQTGDAAKYAGSMQKEFENRSATTAGQLQKTKNKIAELAINLGTVLLPPLNAVLGVMGSGASALADLSNRYPLLTKVVGTAAAATVTLAVASKALAYGYTFVKGGLLLAQGAVISLTGAQVVSTAATKAAVIGQRLYAATAVATSAAVRGVAVATRIMGAVLMGTPVGLILSGVALAAGAVIANWETVGPFFSGLWSGVTGTFSSAWDYIMTSASKVFDWLHGKFEWFRNTVEGFKSVWDYLFGDGKDKPSGVGSPASSTSPSATVTIPPPRYDASSAAPANYSPPAAAVQAVSSSSSGKSRSSVSVPMEFNVSGMDEAEFRRRLEHSRPELERIVKRAVADTEHDKGRVLHNGD